jgi:hypothetical protein
LRGDIDNFCHDSVIKSQQKMNANPLIIEANLSMEEASQYITKHIIRNV